jgi:mitochondrial fission protein ELM1
MISEACATGAPVYIALPEFAGPRQRRLLATLQESAQVRLFKEDLSPWPRTPLDEAGRVAAEIRRRFPLD